MRLDLKRFSKYEIGIKTADGQLYNIIGWYDDCRYSPNDLPDGYYLYEFRASDSDEDEYLSTIETHVLVNHSGSFVTKTPIPFNTEGNSDYFKILYGHYL